MRGACRCAVRRSPGQPEGRGENQGSGGRDWPERAAAGRWAQALEGGQEVTHRERGHSAVVWRASLGGRGTTAGTWELRGGLGWREEAGRGCALQAEPAVPGRVWVRP